MKRKLLMVFAVVCVFGLMASADDKDMNKDGMHKSMAKTVSLKGWITDSMCAAHGVKNCNDKSHLENGGKLAFVSDKDGKIYTIDNGEEFAAHQGHHVKVKGKADAESGTIKVEKVSMLSGS